MPDLFWLPYAAALAAGALVKFVDQIEDAGKKTTAPLRYVPALAYGLLIGYSISFATFSTLWLAVLLAQFAAGKIDRASHFLGFFTALAFAVVFGIFEFTMLDFFAFLAIGFMDELQLFGGALRGYRPFLKLATLVYGLFFRWDYFIAIMLFDSTYYVVGKIFPGAVQRKP